MADIEDEGGILVKLAIYGSGGLGKEVLELAKQVNTISSNWDEIFFVDDVTTETSLFEHKIFSFDKIINIYKDNEIEFVIAVGEPEIRKLLFSKIKNAGYKLTVLIHPNVFISDRTKVGDGSIICSGVFVSCDVKIEENVYIQALAAIGHDCKIGANSVISSFASFGGTCAVGECSFIAMSVPVKEKTNIGSNSIVGLGSVVLRDIPDNVVALGNPARAMKANDDKKVFNN